MLCVLFHCYHHSWLNTWIWKILYKHSSSSSSTGSTAHYEPWPLSRHFSMLPYPELSFSTHEHQVFVDLPLYSLPQVVFQKGSRLMSYTVSQQQNYFTGKDLSTPCPNPQPGGPGYLSFPGPSCRTCLAWDALSVEYTTASIAPEVIRSRKLHRHDKVKIVQT